ncbi:hypothetical protein [Bosea sp. ANAM02]|uniref:hypothetical protein n=1 Tax=Bosea sp. ANAM02 TaxID=2020412 RepID=UPI00140EADD3|nr:hypothetical protein [Bosea sp. ANAM02]BCB17344.1 hypothetical protein OCUBac02_02380 [Bosea sp. ANAM02]
MTMIAASFASAFANPVSFLRELTVPFHENVREKNALSSREASSIVRVFSPVLTFVVFGIMGPNGTKEARGMTFHDPEDARRWRRRLKRQREYQRKYRERLIAERTPERADLASACLEACLTLSLAQLPQMPHLVKAIIDRLVLRGFDRRRSIERLQDLFERLRADR